MRPYARNTRTGEVARVVLRRLHEGDLEAVCALQTLCAEGLADPSVFVINTPAEMLQLMQQGEVYGAFAEDTLAACVAIFMPRTAAQDLAADVLPHRLPEIGNAVLDTCFVHPDYRCSGLARDLARHCARRAFEAMGAERVLCTVSPKNHASLRALLSVEGTRILALRQKYGGRLRYVLCRERAPRAVYTLFERLPLSDTFSISRALADGFVGFSLFAKEENAYLWVAK